MAGKDSKYVFDRGSFSFKEAPRRIWKLLRNIVLLLLVSASGTILMYFAVSLFASTKTERQLRREIRMYEKNYALLEPKADLLADVITGLQVKDNEIYETVFHTGAPDVDPINSLDFLFGSDTIPDSRLVLYTAEKAADLSARTSSVEAAFRNILAHAAVDAGNMPPMILPLENMTYPQVGATKGQKINPFYKAYVQHNGLDLIAPQESPVLATADGVVSDVERSSKGLGNRVTVKHSGGYQTVYAHLSDISVKKDQKVTKGQKIGSVGMSGASYAPHLHYEVLKDGEYMDPVNYIFASVSPEEYANMLFMAVNTQQSMD